METLLWIVMVYLTAGIVFLSVYLKEMLFLVEEAHRSIIWNEDEETAATNIEERLIDKFGKSTAFKILILTTVFLGHAILFTLYCFIERDNGTN